MKKTIRQIRKEKQMTQEELGRKLGVAMITVWKWENGRAMPSVENAEKICDILGEPFENIDWGIRERS